MRLNTLVDPLAAAGGDALAALLGAVTVVRRSKPLHPNGHVVRARVERTGSPQPWGVPWLDEPGTDEGFVRLSHAIGLPEGWPDVLGLALRFTDDEGTHDLLLATTGWLPVARHVLVPAVDATAARYGSLLPYTAPRGRLLLGATPEPVDGAPAFALEVAPLVGPWQQFGTLRLATEPEESGDQLVHLDPVVNLLPGLVLPRPVVALREPSYAVARRLRGAQPT